MNEIKFLTNGNKNVFVIGNYVFLQDRKIIRDVIPMKQYDFNGYTEVTGLDLTQFKGKCKAYLLKFQEADIFDELFGNNYKNF